MMFRQTSSILYSGPGSSAGKSTLSEFFVVVPYKCAHMDIIGLDAN